MHCTENNGSLVIYQKFFHSERIFGKSRDCHYFEYTVQLASEPVAVARSYTLFIILVHCFVLYAVVLVWFSIVN